MNKYLTKVAAILKAELGMPASQKIPAQTLQVMSQIKGPAQRAARGTMNLEARGEHNHPRPGITTMIRQKMR